MFGQKAPTSLAWAGLGGAALVAAVGVAAVTSWSPGRWSWERAGEALAMVCALLLVLLFVLTVRAARQQFAAIQSARGAYLVAGYELTVLVVLALIAIDYLRGAPVQIAGSIASLPTPVLFFGALGGTLISVTAVTSRTADGTWRDRWVLWHLLRPFIGIIVAAIAVLIVQAGILAVGSDPTPTPSGTGVTATGTPAAFPKDILYYLIAFLVGYREATFRELIKKLSDTVLTTGATPARVEDVVPSTGGDGAVVAITGLGLDKASSVSFGTATVTPDEVAATCILVRVPTQADATGTGPVAGGAAVVVPVVVVTPDGSLASTFTYGAIPVGP